MRRSVAGRAGGRPTESGTGRRTQGTTARTRTALRSTLVAIGVLAAALVSAPAWAAPAGPVPAAAPATATDDTSDSDRPVQIEVSDFEPRTLTPDAVISITCTLTNTGDATISHLGLRLQRGAAYATRAELTAADRVPDPATAVVPAFTPVPGSLEPGDSITFTYTLPAAALQLSVPGVYPALLNANGSIQGTERRVGQLATYLVQAPTTPTARTAVAWLWPLVDRTHRNAAGRFTDDDLAREVASNGRLDRALGALERLPKTAPPGGGAAAPSAPVTLAIDPALVEELQIMAAGPYQAGKGAGTGTQAATAFLQRLKAMAAVLPVVALPYGDIDAESLQAAGLADVVRRSLPGSPDGTAHDDRFAGGTSSTAPSSGSGGEAANDGAGARILASALGVRPRTDLAWLAPGPVRPETLSTLHQGGAERVVLPAAALTGGDTALGLGRPAAAAATTVPTADGTLPALVGDTELGSLADAGQAGGGPRIAEQRYLAELTLLSLQAPAGAVPTVLVTPPRAVDADPDAVAAMINDTTATTWLQPSSVESIAGGPAGDTGGLAAPATTPALDPTGLQDVVAAVATRDAVAGAAVRDPDAALAASDASVARATSVEWREAAARFRAAAHDLRTTMTRLADQVTLVAPADGTYSLASNDAPLILTVRNDLPFAVQVLLKLQSPGAGLELGDIGRQTLLPGQRTTLQVPTQVHRTGGFTVIAALTTPSGQALGDPVQIRVKSTAYGPIGLFITIGSAALLGLLFLRRLIRFLRRRRGGPPRGDGLPGPAPEGAAVPLPPTRSPV